MDDVTGRSCLGCGPQEEFYGCADVSIGRERSTEDLRSPNSDHQLQSSDRNGSNDDHDDNDVTDYVGGYNDNDVIVVPSDFSPTQSSGIPKWRNNRIPSKLTQSTLTSSNMTSLTSDAIGLVSADRSPTSGDVSPTTSVAILSSGLISDANVFLGDDSQGGASTPSPAAPEVKPSDWTHVVIDGQLYNVGIHSVSGQAPASFGSDRPLESVTVDAKTVFVFPKWFVIKDEITKAIVLFERELIEKFMRNETQTPEGNSKQSKNWDQVSGDAAEGGEADWSSVTDDFNQLKIRNPESETNSEDIHPKTANRLVGRELSNDGGSFPYLVEEVGRDGDGMQVQDSDRQFTTPPAPSPPQATPSTAKQTIASTVDYSNLLHRILSRRLERSPQRSSQRSRTEEQSANGREANRPTRK